MVIFDNMDIVFSEISQSESELNKSERHILCDPICMWDLKCI